MDGGGVLFSVIRIFLYGSLPCSNGLFHYEKDFNDFNPDVLENFTKFPGKNIPLSIVPTLLLQQIPVKSITHDMKVKLHFHPSIETFQDFRMMLIADEIIIVKIFSCLKFEPTH